jgi:hypothetical protein
MKYWLVLGCCLVCVLTATSLPPPPVPGLYQTGWLMWMVTPTNHGEFRAWSSTNLVDWTCYDFGFYTPYRDYVDTNGLWHAWIDTVRRAQYGRYITVSVLPSDEEEGETWGTNYFFFPTKTTLLSTNPVTAISVIIQ